jgi:segregation and condensation protein B
MENLEQNIEALIFASENSITINDIQHCLKTVYGWELAIDQIRSCIDSLQQKYNEPHFSFALNEIAEGFRFLTKPEYFGAIQVFIQQKNKKRLSTAALETLSIIAYRQPVSKAELEHVRGVSCDYSIQKLLEKELIEITGKSDAPGKPILYGTSKLFMDYFGLKDPKDMPKLKDLQAIDNAIGTSFESLDSEVQQGITLAAATDNHVVEINETENNETSDKTDTDETQQSNVE